MTLPGWARSLTPRKIASLIGAAATIGGTVWYVWNIPVRIQRLEAEGQSQVLKDSTYEALHTELRYDLCVAQGYTEPAELRDCVH